VSDNGSDNPEGSLGKTVPGLGVSIVEALARQLEPPKLFDGPFWWNVLSGRRAARLSATSTVRTTGYARTKP
jgi:hypothetical protein